MKQRRSHIDLQLCDGLKNIPTVLLGGFVTVLILSNTKVCLTCNSLDMRECNSSSAAERLFDNLTRDYNSQVRPVSNDSQPVTVNFSLSISQLIDIDERNQIMTTSVWVKHKWTDVNLRWDPSVFDGIEEIHIPAARLWRPDILLYNNADGHFDVQFLVNAIVRYDGSVEWFPPAIYKSACKINIEDFPFDEQKCKMKFGPWTHDSSKIDMACEKDIVDQEDYWPNGEWEIKESPGSRSSVDYPCCPNEFYVDVTYHFVLHRKPLFYVVTLVGPCLLISFLTILVFYLPSDAQEKITLSVSILLALIVFLLLIPSLIPPTSTTLPLIGRYMLFTMVLVTLSITITVFVINMHFRSARTHNISPWMKKIFLDVLPQLLCVSRPGQKTSNKYRALKKKGNFLIQLVSSIGSNREKKEHKQNTYVLDSITPSLLEEIENRDKDFEEALGNAPLHKDCLEIIENVETIARHFEREDLEEEISEDWKVIAIVIDRLFLWIFTIVCFSGTFGIFWQAEMLREPADFHNVTNYTQAIVSENESFEQIKMKNEILGNVGSY